MPAMMVRVAAAVFSVAGLVAGLGGSAAASTYRVGLGETYRELTLLPPLVPGDIVEVVGGFTYQPVKFEADGTAAQPIIIRGLRNGIGRRPLIANGDNALELAGDHYVVEGMELTGGALRCLFVHADDLVLRDLLIHDCPNHGIEGGGYGGGTITLEYSEVHHTGRGALQHQIYVATDERAHLGAKFVMRFNWIHDATGGNNVKSRAERNEIYFNRIEGALYHELELIGPDPADAGVTENQAVENSDVVGNVFAKGGGHSSFWIARIGGDGTGQTYGRYRFVHNTFVLASDSAGAFRVFDGIDSFEAHNNVFYKTSIRLPAGNCPDAGRPVRLPAGCGRRSRPGPRDRRPARPARPVLCDGRWSRPAGRRRTSGGGRRRRCCTRWCATTSRASSPTPALAAPTASACLATSSASCATTSRAASSPTASVASAAPTAASTAWSRSRVRAGPSVRPAEVDAWRTRPHTW